MICLCLIRNPNFHVIKLNRFFLVLWLWTICLVYRFICLICFFLLRLLKGRSIPGKILLSPRDPIDNSSLYSPTFQRSYSDAGTSNRAIETVEVNFVFIFCGYLCYVLLCMSIRLIGSTSSSVSYTINTGGSSKRKPII